MLSVHSRRNVRGSIIFTRRSRVYMSSMKRKAQLQQRKFILLKTQCLEIFHCQQVTFIDKGTMTKFSGADIHLNSFAYHSDEPYHNENLSIVSEVCLDKSSFISQRTRGVYRTAVCHFELMFDFDVCSQYISPIPLQLNVLTSLFRKPRIARLGLSFVKLDHRTVSLTTLADASFTRNSGFTSHLGFSICLVDEWINTILLHYGSFKLKRITRSVKDAKLFTVKRAFDYFYAVHKTLNKLFELTLTIKIYSDSKSFYDGVKDINWMMEKIL